MMSRPPSSRSYLYLSWLVSWLALGLSACAGSAVRGEPLPAQRPSEPAPDRPQQAQVLNPNEPPQLGDAEPWVVRTGTSFGMCQGFCLVDVTLAGVTKHMLRRDPSVGTSLGCYRAPSPSVPPSAAPFDAATFEAFSKLPETLGCPDCADGGAEYLELQQRGRRHRVAFEYGKTIAGFESLLDYARQESRAFSECK